MAAKKSASKKSAVRTSKPPAAKKSATSRSKSAAKKVKPASKSTSTSTLSGKSPSELIDGRIAELPDWRGEMLAHLRTLIHEADGEVVETWKWMGTPVWEDHGIICTGETYKQVVKLTFPKGASLADPKGLFNSSLEGSTRRAIDFRQDEVVDAAGFKSLIREAVALNKSKPAKR